MLTFSGTEYPKCAVLMGRDLETQRLCRLYDFIKAQLARPRVACFVAGNVSSTDGLNFVIESVRPDTA
jgi:hypothetical protein